tara:strand:- start:878 stop:1045 length:168 start_codon:yes stop_codon:yes gene_type:complete
MNKWKFTYNFYARNDKNEEAIDSVAAPSRYQAALFFSKQKRLDLKTFLKVYAVSR